MIDPNEELPGQPGQTSLIEPAVTVARAADDEDILGKSEHEVFRAGNFFAECLGKENHTVHCFEVPSVHAYAAYTPILVGPMTVPAQSDLWRNLAKKHGKGIQDAAERGACRTFVAGFAFASAGNLGDGYAGPNTRRRRRWSGQYSAGGSKDIRAARRELLKSPDRKTD